MKARIRTNPVLTGTVLREATARLQSTRASLPWGTTPEQQVLIGALADIADLAEQSGFKPQAITIVGEVVSLREKLHWFDGRPLFGKKVMVTRAADQAGEFATMLADRGATVLECPTIRIVEPEQWGPLDAALRNLSAYDWLVMTSGNAVRAFFQRLDTLGLDARALGSCRVCALGPKTADALRGFGIRSDMLAADY